MALGWSANVSGIWGRLLPPNVYSLLMEPKVIPTPTGRVEPARPFSPDRTRIGVTAKVRPAAGRVCLLPLPRKHELVKSSCSPPFSNYFLYLSLSNPSIYYICHYASAVAYLFLWSSDPRSGNFRKPSIVPVRLSNHGDYIMPKRKLAVSSRATKGPIFFRGPFECRQPSYSYIIYVITVMIEFMTIFLPE